ncbi:MAG: hypothetical protein J0L94_07335 [Rhodothermia bacterium]|nr:hypothetical protein [Rhodothermia bacterium]
MWRLLFFFSGFVLGCKNTPETPLTATNWTGNWIDEGTRQVVLKNGTFLATQTLPIELIFTDRADSVYVQNGTFESGAISYQVKKPNQLEIRLFDAQKPTTVTLEDENHLSFHNHRTGTDHTFVRIKAAVTDKQIGAVMPNYYLEHLLKGKYRVVGQNKEEPNVQAFFTILANGRVQGLDATHVQLVIGGDLAAADIDVLSLINITRRQVRHLGWRKEGAKLLLYYLVNAADKTKKFQYRAGKVAFVLERITD